MDRAHLHSRQASSWGVRMVQVSGGNKVGLKPWQFEYALQLWVACIGFVLFVLFEAKGQAARASARSV